MPRRTFYRKRLIHRRLGMANAILNFEQDPSTDEDEEIVPSGLIQDYVNPELSKDILPQPYRMIVKVLDDVLDTAWNKAASSRSESRKVASQAENPFLHQYTANSYLKDAEDVTCVAMWQNSVYVGTASGRLIWWSLGETTQIECNVDKEILGISVGEIAPGRGEVVAVLSSNGAVAVRARCWSHELSGNTIKTSSTFISLYNATVAEATVVAIDRFASNLLVATQMGSIVAFALPPYPPIPPLEPESSEDRRKRKLGKLPPRLPSADPLLTATAAPLAGPQHTVERPADLKTGDEGGNEGGNEEKEKEKIAPTAHAVFIYASIMKATPKFLPATGHKSKATVGLLCWWKEHAQVVFQGLNGQVRTWQLPHPVADCVAGCRPLSQLLPDELLEGEGTAFVQTRDVEAAAVLTDGSVLILSPFTGGEIIVLERCLDEGRLPWATHTRSQVLEEQQHLQQHNANSATSTNTTTRPFTEYALTILGNGAILVAGPQGSLAIYDGEEHRRLSLLSEMAAPAQTLLALPWPMAALAVDGSSICRVYDVSYPAESAVQFIRLRVQPPYKIKTSTSALAAGVQGIVIVAEKDDSSRRLFYCTPADIICAAYPSIANACARSNNPLLAGELFSRTRPTDRAGEHLPRAMKSVAGLNGGRGSLSRSNSRLSLRSGSSALSATSSGGPKQRGGVNLPGPGVNLKREALLKTAKNLQK
jgi:hypothetical protein